MPSNVATPCRACGASLDCVDVNPLDIYSLEGPTFRFVLECPPGSNCTNTSSLTLTCCGKIIRAIFPPGMSAFDRTVAINEAIRECAVANLFCGENIPLQPVNPTPDQPHPPLPPPIILYYSHAVNLDGNCPGGSVFHYHLPAGYFVAQTQEEADRLAQEFAARQVVSGQFCLRVPTLCACTDIASTLTIPISGGVAPFSAAFAGGHLPDGMTISVSGHNVLISGTPTTPGTYSVTINVSDAFGSYLTNTVSIHILNIGYVGMITTGFTVPAVSSTVTSSIGSDKYSLNDVIHVVRQVGGINTLEMGTLKITALDTPSIGFVELTNLTATPGDTVLIGDVGYWDMVAFIPNAVVGVPFSIQLPAVGGSGSYVWSTTDSLPSGWALSNSGVLSGVPADTDPVDLAIAFIDNACPQPPPPPPPIGQEVYWGILDAIAFDPNDVFVFGSVDFADVIAALETETAPYRSTGYHMLNPSMSGYAFGWFIVPDSYTTPANLTGFKWVAGAGAIPIGNVMNTPNYNAPSPPFPPDATILNALIGDTFANDWYYFAITFNGFPYRVYIFSECTVPYGGFFQLDGSIGSDTFTLFVST